MSPDDARKQKHQPTKPGLRQTLEGVLERLREGLDTLADELRPRPQPAPIPIPSHGPRRR